MYLLNLIRWKNLLMIALVQLLIKYALLEPYGAQTRLDGLGISLLILACICIAAAGNIINDIYDVETDFINKPKRLIVGTFISEKTAYNLFIAFNIMGVGIGFYVSHLVDKSAFFSMFVITSALLYIYASYLKRILLIGNIVISLLVALSIVMVGVFELLPDINHHNQNTQLAFFKIIFNYALFAFMINMLREIAKDLEDINGDYKAGMNTLPIAIGRKRTNHVLIALMFISIIILIYYVTEVLYKQLILVGYFLIFCVGPLLFILLKTFNAKTKKDYHSISNGLKIIMLFGMLSLSLYLVILRA
ncbi:geranylgeranylglycerol-phosphate geranylgeranyltransferase [Mariniflexile ostreae]|uniref:Geranylgeranylglycerol-phosphate geranylgeranyltransferase n=1 Tax=Mariniflexile ostreae TaxID=1520892 RepID=A0ABV5F7Y1_9FLAO